MDASEIKKNIIDLYDKYGDRKPVINGKVLNLDDDGHHRTFIFFIVSYRLLMFKSRILADCIKNKYICIQKKGGVYVWII